MERDFFFPFVRRENCVARFGNNVGLWVLGSLRVRVVRALIANVSIIAVIVLTCKKTTFCRGNDECYDTNEDIASPK